MQYALRTSAAIFFCGSLVACGTLPAPSPDVGKVIRISEKALETSVRICRDGRVILDIAAGPAIPAEVRIPATVARDLCAVLLSGGIPDAANDRTPEDLRQTIDAIRNILKRSA